MKAAFLAVASLAMNATAADTDAAAGAINQLGLDLQRLLTKPDANLCLSPYSIQGALAMTFAGADGDTRDEMASVLHFPKGDGIHASFAALNRALADTAAKTAKIAANAKKWGGPSEPIMLTVANRLFGQKDYEFRAPFTAMLKATCGAPMEMLDFHKAAEPARIHINQWVEGQTQRRIRDLVPTGMITADTRLVLANAIYLKAPWANEFSERATTPEAFYVRGKSVQQVPTMRRQAHCGFAQRKGFRAVSIPYTGGDVHFLILLPDKVDGLADVEKGLAAATLAEFAKMENREVILHLPKFRIEGDTVELSKGLMALGMKTAFDKPERSANFDRMAPRRPEEYLYVSAVMHKTFLALDEKGTEAAAATAVVMAPAGAAPVQSKPVEVKVDRPFLFAIQHAPSGACLFLGRVNDPAAK
jgi:serpin B